MKTRTIFAINGSLRAVSSTSAIIRAAARLASEYTVLDEFPTIAALPHFSPDLDCDPLPASVTDLRARIAEANALLIASPEYAHGIPGSLKNSLDWLVSATEPVNKPTLLICASPSGAPHAHAHLLEVLRTMNLNLIDAGAHPFSKSTLDPNGEVADPAILSALRNGLSKLVF